MAAMPPPILLTVDDDPEVSRSLARDLRQQYGEDYRIRRAESGPAALDALKELKLRDDKVGLLLADQRMPEMTGVEFLAEARQFYPKARRVLLTAYADTDAAIAAINRADVHYYLLKPWDPPQEKLYPVLDDLLEDWKMQDRLKSDDRIRVVGHRWSAPSHEVKDFLTRNQVPFKWLELERDAEAARLLAANGGDARAPATGDHRHGPDPAGSLDGRGRRRPRALVDPVTPFYDLIVIGGGPGRPGCRRLRGLGRSAHRAGRARGDRGPGRPELQDRELPRLSVWHPRAATWPGGRPPRPAGSGRRCCSPRRWPAWRCADRPGSSAWPTAAELSAHAVLVTTGVAYRRLAAPGDRRLYRKRRLLRGGDDRGPVLPGRGRLHRRRSQLGRPGGRVLRSHRSKRHPRGAGRRASSARCPIT